MWEEEQPHGRLVDIYASQPIQKNLWDCISFFFGRMIELGLLVKNFGLLGGEGGAMHKMSGTDCPFFFSIYTVRFRLPCRYLSLI